MKRKLLSKSLALAITAAMTMTSLTPCIAMAEDEFAAVEEFGDGFTDEETAETPDADAQAEVFTEDAEVSVPETEEKAGFGDEEAAEEAVVAATDSVAVGTPGIPAKVTGVWIDTDGEQVNEPTLRWNYIPGVYCYEIVLVDGEGREYTDYPKWDQAAEKYVPNYYEIRDIGEVLPSISVSRLKDMRVYSISADGRDCEMVYADTEKKNPLTALASGQAYTIKVRAVNKYQANENEKAVETPGEWSDGVVYTALNAAPIQIQNLRYVSEDDEYLYFDFDGDISGGYIYCYYTDSEKYAELDEGQWEHVYNSTGNNAYKIRLYKDEFTSGKTYYLRAANYVDGKTVEDAQGRTIWSNVISFTISKKEQTLKTITGFKLERTTRDAFWFVFDSVLENGDQWELQYSKDANFVADVKKAYGRTIQKSNLDPDVAYYVRAVTYKYDENGGKVYGTPSEVVQVSRTKIPTISNLTVEKEPYSYVFRYAGTLTGKSGVEYWISEDVAFSGNPSVTKVRYTNEWDEEDDYYYEDTDNSFYVSASNLTPGKTYYVRARAYSWDEALRDDNTAEYYYFGDFTNTVTLKPAVPKAEVSTAAASTSITLRMTPVDSQYVTGYEIQKKSGKKYTALTKVTEGQYTDSKLKSDTAYSYRVRAYYIDEKTNKTYWGEWDYCDATTWGGNLNLVASPRGKTSVKLTWNKISGAKGYEVYRSTNYSDGTKTSADTGYNGYTKWVLVKTITKSSTKTYTVKGLTAGRSYNFKVRAYKTVGSKKYYIDDMDNATLSFGGSVQIVKEKVSASGSVTVTWKPVYTGSGYVIEKRDQTTDTTDTWEVYKTITKASTSSATLPKATDETDTYRIRAYKNGTPKEYSHESRYISVSPYLAVPTGVTAKVNSADGSITVSWKPVSGADYYKVYRTTSPAFLYDADRKAYSYNYGMEVPVYVADANSRIGYKRSDEDLKATTLTDRPITYTNLNGIQKTVYTGPKAAIKYYYYVVAYKEVKGHVYEDDMTTYSSGNSAAAAATVSKASVAKPTLSSVKSTSKGKAAITWKKVTGAKGYEVYRSTKKSSGYTRIASISGGSTVKYTDKKATSGKKYYYKVRALGVNEAGITIYSSYSRVKYVKVK